MSDLVARLRNNCSCNFSSTPCGAEEQCRNAFDAADRIEKLEAVLKKMTCTCLYNCMDDINQICSDFEARHVLEGK